MDNISYNNDEDEPTTKLSILICKKLYLDKETADICFIFEHQNNDEIDIVPAHKLILTKGSKVFHTMFNGSLPEEDVVRIGDATVAAFKQFLQFFYMDQVTLTLENIAEVMNLIEKYEIERCMKQCIDFMKDTMTKMMMFV